MDCLSVFLNFLNEYATPLSVLSDIIIAIFTIVLAWNAIASWKLSKSLLKIEEPRDRKKPISCVTLESGKSYHIEGHFNPPHGSEKVKAIDIYINGSVNILLTNNKQIFFNKFCDAVM